MSTMTERAWSFLVCVSWPEGDGYLIRLPGGGTGIGLRERARPYPSERTAEEACVVWGRLVTEAQRRQGKRTTNHAFSVREEALSCPHS